MGPVEVLTDDARPLGLAGQKARGLLGLLLLNANNVVPADELAERLWGEAPTAMTSLQVQVSRLRKVLQQEDGAVTLAGRRPGYILEVDPETIDASVFDRLVADAADALARGDPERASAAYDEALALWRGPLLVDAGLKGPLIAEAARLEEARIAAIEGQVDAELARGHHKELVSKLESLLIEHPFREKLWASTMLALYRSGRQADALLAFHRLRGLLSDQLGIDPSAPLRQLHEAILRQDAALDWMAPSNEAREKPLPLPSPLWLPASAPFVGRQAELDWLTGVWEAARAGERNVVLLAGDAGIGKTRLASKLAMAAHRDGATVLFGRSDEEAIVPYQPFVEALRHVVVNLPTDVLEARAGGRRGAHLARLVPELRERIADLPALDEESESRRYQLFEAVGTLLSQTAAERPVLLVLDDLQWADRASTQLLRHLLRPGEPTALLIVCTYRDAAVEPHDPLADLLGDLRRERIGERVRLEGLSFPEVADLCRSFSFDGKDLPVPMFVETLRQKTAGNPFFMEEILRHLGEVGSENGRIPWDSLRWVEEVGLPESVKEVVFRRLSRVSEQSKRILTLAAAVGTEFSVDLVERLVDVPEDDVLSSLEEAATMGIISELEGGFARYTFAHALIRQALYESFLSIRRVRLHRRIAEAIEELYAGDIDAHLPELAHHYYLAAPGGAAAQAVEYAIRAGLNARRKLAYEEAAQYYRHALEVLEETESTDDRKRCEVLLELGDAQWRSGDLLPARATFEQSIPLARALGDPVLLARAALGFGTGFGGYGQTVRADETMIAYLQEALDVLGTRDDPLCVRLLARLSIELYFTPQAERCAKLADEAVAMARRLDDSSSLLIALLGREWATLGPDKPLDERLRATNEVVALAEALGNKEVEYLAQFIRQIALVESGDLRTADEAIASAQELAGELRMPGLVPWVTAYRAMRAAFSGQYEEADELIQRALEQAVSLNLDPYVTMMFLGGQAVTQRVSRVPMPEMIPVLQTMADENPHHPVVRCTLALFAVHQRKLDIAREAVGYFARDGFETIPRDGNWLMSTWALGMACAGMNDVENTAILYERLLPFAGRWACSSISTSFGPVSTALGMMAARLGRFDEAEGHLSRALDQAAAQRASSLRLLALQVYSVMLAQRNGPGDREKALAQLDEVVEGSRALGIAVLEEDARGVRARIRARTADPQAVGKPARKTAAKRPTRRRSAT